MHLEQTKMRREQDQQHLEAKRQYDQLKEQRLQEERRLQRQAELDRIERLKEEETALIKKLKEDFENKERLKLQIKDLRQTIATLEQKKVALDLDAAK